MEQKDIKMRLLVCSLLGEGDFDCFYPRLISVSLDFAETFADMIVVDSKTRK